jgi:hypothetical protein
LFNVARKLSKLTRDVVPEHQKKNPLSLHSVNGLLVRSALAGICYAPRKLKIKSAHTKDRQPLLCTQGIAGA